MKRICCKQPKVKTRILSRKRITSKISKISNIQHNEYTSQNIISTFSSKTPLRFYKVNDDNESYYEEDDNDESYYKENVDDESYYGEDDDESYYKENDNDESYYRENDDDESYYGEDDEEQVGQPDTSSNTEYIQTIVDGRTDFEPLPGEYSPYFQNFTEMMLFTWVTKHMISK